MRLRYTYVRSFALAAILVALASGVPLAQETARVRPGSGSALVRGTVWNADNAPVPGGIVRLRNLYTGRVETSGITNERGEFGFERVPSASYLTEAVDEGGKVLAVGQTFRIESAETVAAFIRIPARRSWLAGAFSNTASAVIAAASSAGITAMGSKAPPVSPQ
jgi:hypothetical protein